MANKTKGWGRFLCVSCTHGAEADPRALDAMLRLREAWKPDFVVHLGDFIDARALRAGARRDSDSSDHAASLMDDLLQGLSFLRELKPNVVMLGNHEARLTELAHSPNAVLAYAAQNVMSRIEDEMAKLKCRIIPYAGVHKKGMFMLSRDTGLIHGSAYGVSAARDTSEYTGHSIIMGHTHRVAMESARIHARAVGWNIGCGIKLDIGYSANRRQTLGWRHAACYGHFNATYCAPNLAIFDPHYELPL
jgi:predicted phosphodiesterase